MRSLFATAALCALAILHPPDIRDDGTRWLWSPMNMELYFVSRARAQANDTNTYLRSWIAERCCVTNDCCFEVAPGTVEALPDGRFLVVASGQVIARTGWSPDEKFWRCACDNI